MINRIKKIMLKILSPRVILQLKMGIERFKYVCIMKEIERGKLDDSIFIFGTPMHENLGDHLITYSEILFLKELGYSKIVEIPIEVFKYYKEELKKSIPFDATIYVNGGGWMGDVWECDEIMMQEIVSSFVHHKIIIFPQTIFYSKNGVFKDLLESGKKTYTKCPKLTICVRDRNSYNFAIENYKGIKILLQPDITCFLHGKIQFNNKKTTWKRKVGFCIRKDREQMECNYISEIKKLFLERNYKCFNISTVLRYRVPTFYRKNALMHKFKQFLKFDIIVTDRLHGMLFAYILDKPCIVVDNSTKKISGVYFEWLHNNNNIRFIQSESDIELLRDNLFSLEEKEMYENLDYKMLLEEIRDGKY